MAKLGVSNKMAMHQSVKQIAETIKRFPLPVICSLLFCILIILHASFFSCDKTHFVILFSECFWLISVQLYAESRRWSVGEYYLMSLPISAFIAWYFYAFNTALYAFPFLGAGLFILMFIAPFIGKAVKSAEIWWFQYRLFIQICFTTMISILLFIFVCFVIYSFELLFDFKLPDNLTISYMLPIIATFLAPVIAMSGIPTSYTFTSTDYPNFIRLTLSYLVIPALLVYCTVLYIYTAKILISWQLPIGNLAYLFSIFGVSGIVTYVACYSFRKISGIFKLFCDNFFRVLPVITILLGSAICTRIYEFGVTESRYFIFLLLIWFILCTFFHFFSAENKVIKLIFISIVVQLIIAAFAPFGAVSISEWSQNHRLEKILVQNGMLSDGKLHKSINKLDSKTVADIKSIIKYLVETEKTYKLKIWLQSDEDKSIHNNTNSITANSVLERMGLSSENT
ncbi:DUF4153 domain-containing protein [Candidatus Lariskella endosymbiont of Epinotia ramella]|uniref:DUF4153 domain-containing protein n=1 Tax=Candidatus Lariskella endosymbiont of Epinotia ramella TaxID=3066224 RepID=UPI0030D17EF0